MYVAVCSLVGYRSGIISHEHEVIEHQRQCEVQDKAWMADESIHVVDTTKTKVQLNGDLAWLWSNYSAEQAISHETAMTQSLYLPTTPCTIVRSTFFSWHASHGESARHFSPIHDHA